MNNSWYIKTETSAVQKYLNDLIQIADNDNIHKIIKSNAEDLKNQVANSLLRATPGGSDILNGIRRSGSGKLRKKGIGLVDCDDGVSVLVSISQKHADFRLHFIEEGTAIRKTEKGYNRGELNPKLFFTNTVNSQKDKLLNNIINDIKVTIESL